MLTSQPDIVCFGFVNEAKNPEFVVHGHEEFFSCIQDALSKYNIRSYVWAKFWRRSFLEKYKLHFFPNIYSEDVLFTWEAISNAGSLMYSSAKLYSYSTTEGSMVLCRDLNHLQWTVESYIIINARLKELAHGLENIKRVKNTFSYHYHVLFNRCLCSFYSYHEISRIFKKCSQIGIGHLTDERRMKVFDFCYHHPFIYYIFHKWIISLYFKRQRFKPSERDFIQLSEALDLQKGKKRLIKKSEKQ